MTNEQKARGIMILLNLWIAYLAFSQAGKYDDLLLAACAGVFMTKAFDHGIALLKTYLAGWA